MRHLAAAFFALALIHAGTAAPARAEPFRLSAPPVAQSLVFAVMADQDLAPGGLAVEFIPWHSPDQARALVAGGRVDGAVIAIAAAAALYNRGVPLKIAGVFNTPLWVVSAKTAARPGPLSGILLFPFGHREMPELIFDAVFGRERAGLDTRHTGGSLEAVNLLLAGRAHHALLTEPAAGMAIARAAALGTGSGLVRHRDFREVWADKFNGRPLYASTLAVFRDAAARPDRVGKLLRGYGRAVGWIRKHPGAALAIAQKKIPALAAQAIDGRLPEPGGDLTWGPGAFEPTFFLLGKIHEQSPAALGGKPPAPEIFMEVK